MRMKTQDWDDVLDTNLKSAFLLSRSVLRTMLKQREGCILNVSSVVGITGNGGQTNYSASKAGLIGFTKSLAREVASRNLRVNSSRNSWIPFRSEGSAAWRRRPTRLSSSVPPSLPI